MRIISLMAAGVLTAFGGCVRTVHLETVEVAQDIRTRSPARTATNLPARFTVVVPARTAGDCPPRLRDPEAGASLDLFRSMTMPVRDAGLVRYESFGDYRITPPGHYGTTSPMDGLRVDCAALRAMGLVSLGEPGGG
jgi:hypothetical protein